MSKSEKPQNPITVKDPLVDIIQHAPPAADPFLYISMVEKILIEDSPSPDLLAQLLPLLDGVLQETWRADLIGWFLVPTLLQVPGSESCLITIARLGNPREVMIPIIQALKDVDLAEVEDDWVAEGNETEPAPTTAIHNELDRFCFLLNILEILHSRLQLKYPSRHLATSCLAIMEVFQPSHRAVAVVLKFIHSLSGKKRPPLPGRKSSVNIPSITTPQMEKPLPTAPDPEAEATDTNESAIQTKLLQSLVTHVLEEYVQAFPIEWAGRLNETFDPKHVVAGRTSLGEAFKKEPTLHIRDTIIGQLVALCRDLDLVNYDLLNSTIYSTAPTAYAPDPAENLPNSPEEIPLSKNGCLYLLAALIFSSTIFKTNTPLPTLSIFPSHSNLLTQFYEASETAPHAIPDAIVSIGLWLEHNNKFVSKDGDFEFKDHHFNAYLHALTLWSASLPSPVLRYCTYTLASKVLHTHPVDSTRFAFITQTLRESPSQIFDATDLKACAITWLKEEIETAKARGQDNIFSSSAVLRDTQSLLFPNLEKEFAGKEDEELLTILGENRKLYMAQLSFLSFVTGEGYVHLVPEGMVEKVKEEYLEPLSVAQKKCAVVVGEDDGEGMGMGLELLGEQVAVVRGRIEG